MVSGTGAVSDADRGAIPDTGAGLDAGGVKIAAIDVGTVSSRLMCATVRDGIVVDSRKHTVITDLGEGVDASGVFAPAAIERVSAACGEFAGEARAYGAVAMCTTLTSAARDVSNGEDLLGRLRALGLKPEVIPGTIEARLTFHGVARDFPGERIAVADSGGGSTELVVGACVPMGPSAGLELECVRSIDIGCRRVTERFFSDMPPRPDEVERASSWAHSEFQGYWDALPSRPDRLVAVGGTVTSLVASARGLAAYDSRLVHLRDLTMRQVDEAINLMGGMDVDEIAALPGIQAKRAPVILAGALTIRELMRAGGYDRLTVSENGLLAGAIAAMFEMMVVGSTVIGWKPGLAPL